MNAQDIALLKEILDDLRWAKIIYGSSGLDDSISKLTMRIEELEIDQ